MDSFLPTVFSGEKKLSSKECASAVKKLHDRQLYRSVNRRLCDPVKPGEPNFVLFSFIPSTGATPDTNGFYGVAKIRGAFFNVEDADKRAEELIRDVDSANTIYTTICGSPFPLVVKGFAKDTVEIDISKKVEQTISDNVRAKRKADEKEMREIEERRRSLFTDDGQIIKAVDPAEKYVEQRVKLAHLRYAIQEHYAKLEECKKLEASAREHLKECIAEHPEYEENYLSRYKEGRRKANIPEATDFTGFMKFFADPIDPDEKGTDVSYIS